MQVKVILTRKVFALSLVFNVRVFGTRKWPTEIWKCLFLRRGKTGLPGEKPLGARKRTNNKLNLHMALSLLLVGSVRQQ